MNEGRLFGGGYETAKLSSAYHACRHVFFLASRIAIIVTDNSMIKYNTGDCGILPLLFTCIRILISVRFAWKVVISVQ